MNCNVLLRGNRHVGVVMDLSPGGFFVQTGAVADIGATVDVALQGRRGGTVEVRATVTNHRAVPRSLASVIRGGIGCRLKGASEDYDRLLAQIT